VDTGGAESCAAQRLDRGRLGQDGTPAGGEGRPLTPDDRGPVDVGAAGGTFATRRGDYFFAEGSGVWTGAATAGAAMGGVAAQK
jgi:hypothetical protein